MPARFTSSITTPVTQPSTEQATDTSTESWVHIVTVCIYSGRSYAAAESTDRSKLQSIKNSFEV